MRSDGITSIPLFTNALLKYNLIYTDSIRHILNICHLCIIKPVNWHFSLPSDEVQKFITLEMFKKKRAFCVTKAYTIDAYTISWILLLAPSTPKDQNNSYEA